MVFEGPGTVTIPSLDLTIIGTFNNSKIHGKAVAIYEKTKSKLIGKFDSNHNFVNGELKINYCAKNGEILKISTK